MTAVCPILMHAVFVAVKPEAPIDGKLLAAAAGCLGSCCSWWVRDGSDKTIGSCGLGNGQQYPDPATTARDVKGEK